MTTQLVDRVLAEVESATDEIVAFAADLVRVPTVNPPGEAYETCAHLLGDRLRDCGFDVRYLVADDRLEHTVNSTGRRNTSMMRCCNAETETEKVRPGGSACDAFAWSAAGNGACGAATVLEGDRAGAVE